VKDILVYVIVKKENYYSGLVNVREKYKISMYSGIIVFIGMKL
jgi:hypothetical protein